MKITLEIGKILGVAAAALFGQVILGAGLSALLGPVWPEGPGPEAIFPPLALGQVLMVMALLAPAYFSGLPKRSLFWALFWAIFGLGVFLTHIEAAVFLVMTTDQLLFGFLNGTLHALWLAWLMAMVFGKEPAGLETENTETRKAETGDANASRGLPFRLLVTSSFCYLVLYFVAGMLIYAHIEAYYATQNIPPLPWLVTLQLVRGALYVLFVSRLLASLTLKRNATSLAMALMFPMLAGVASLLVPNVVMPDAVRYWHMLEIGVSNFLFGALVGYLFWPGAAKVGSRLSQSALRGSEVQA